MRSTEQTHVPGPGRPHQSLPCAAKLAGQARRAGEAGAVVAVARAGHGQVHCEYERRTLRLTRLRQQIDVTADGELIKLLDELSSYPAPSGAKAPRATVSEEYAGVVVPLRFVTDAGTLSLFSTTTIFGTPVDITLSELAIESFFPADAATAELLRAR